MYISINFWIFSGGFGPRLSQGQPNNEIKLWEWCCHKKMLYVGDGDLVVMSSFGFSPKIVSNKNVWMFNFGLIQRSFFIISDVFTGFIGGKMDFILRLCFVCCFYLLIYFADTFLATLPPEMDLYLLSKLLLGFIKANQSQGGWIKMSFTLKSCDYFNISTQSLCC